MGVASRLLRIEIMSPEQHAVIDWLHLVQAEYLEMPGLHLTRPQIQRLWGLDTATCDTVLQELLDAHVLRRTLRDAYVLTSVAAAQAVQL
jgi:hypothetical protein